MSNEMEVENNSNSLTIQKSTIWMIATIVLAIVLAISIYTGGFSFNPTGAAVANNPAPTIVDNPSDVKAPNAPSINTNALIDDDAVLGDEDAPVTIIEFSDYQCPYCKRFYDQTFGQIDEQYIQTGKVKFVYRDFPLSFHPYAQKAAEAAECAGEQGKYYEMGDLLFEKGVEGGVDAYKGYAAEIGLDTSEFNDCLDSGKMADEIKADMEAGRQAGITGTPGFIINGEEISGAQPFENFKKVIDAKLAE